MSLVAVVVSAGSSVAAESKKPTYALLVDKKTNQLLLTEYQAGKLVTVKTYHATLGQVKGDKEEEGDLKTPEGIYTFKAKLTPPGLASKFGKIAFYVNFPNTYDDMAGHTGSSIMLHATNEPERLKQNYDSKGCVVVHEDEIEEIQKYIRLGLTPIMIYPELSDEYLHPGDHGPLKAFFDSWIHAWETKSIDDYIDHYHADFKGQGKTKSAWKAYKADLNKRYASIEIGPEDVRFYRHPKYSMITFTQNYRSKLKGGGWGHRSRGTKILYVGEEAGKPKIIAETYTELMW